MDVRGSLKGQYRAALKMLRDCVEKCPDDVWVSGQHPRNFWRIAYHAVFYAHLYGSSSWESFEPWDKHIEDADCLWESPAVIEPFSREDVLSYIDAVDGHIDEGLDSLDLESPESGFSWYPNMAKLDHVMLSIRHLQGHVGQLSELLMANGVDINWVSRVPR